MSRHLRPLFLLVLALTSFSLAAAGRPLAPRTIAPTAYPAMRPVVAYSGGRFLTVWREAMGVFGEQLMGAFSDSGGARLSQRSFAFDIPPAAARFSYELVGTGESFVLFWSDADNVTHMAGVDAEGHLTDERTILLPAHVFPRYSWNGTHFLAVLTLPGASSATVVMFDRDGRIVLPSTPLPGATYATDVAVANGRFIVVTNAFDSLAAQEVTPQGFGPRRTIDTYGSPAEPGQGLVVATPAGDGGVLVIWSTIAGQSAELKSIVLHSDGTLGAEQVLVAATTELTPMEVLPSGGGYLVAYTVVGAANVQASLSTVRLDAAGAKAGEPVVASHLVPPTRSSAASDSVIFIPYPAEQPGVAGGQPNIFTLAIAADGQARPAEIVSLRWSRQLQPVLGAGGNGALATWVELPGAPAVVRAIALEGDGELARPPMQVAQGFLAATETQWNDSRSVVESGQHLVIHRDDSRLMATRVAPDAEAVDETPIVLADLTGAWYAEAAVTWADSRWIVVWSDGRALHSLTISREGTASAARALDLPTPLEGEDWVRIIRRPQLSYDGSEVLLVWSEAQRPSDDAPWAGELLTKTWAARLDKNGALFDLQPPLDLDMDGPSLSVASSGFDFMVVAGQHARVLKGDGPLRVTAARDLFGWRAMSDVTWDEAGDQYAVALRYHGSLADWYLAMLRLDGHANDTGIRFATATLTPDEEAAPSIAFPTTGIGLIGVQEGTAADGVSATVYRHFELGFMPSPPGAPRNVRVQRLSRSAFEVSWNAPAEGDPDSYIVERLLGDTWIPAARVEGHVRSVRVEGFESVPVLRVRAFNAGGPSEPAGEESGGPRRRSVR